jgi:hypothetical protein
VQGNAPEVRDVQESVGTIHQKRALFAALRLVLLVAQFERPDPVRVGIARALLKIDPDMRGVLKSRGLLTRDARIKERKKPGLKRARKAPTFTKR